MVNFSELFRKKIHNTHDLGNFIGEMETNKCRKNIN